MAARFLATRIGRRALSSAPALARAPLDRGAFSAPFEAVCCDALSRSRAGAGAERDEAAVTMAEAASRRAAYVTDRWFRVLAEGSDVVTPEQFDVGISQLIGGGDARSLLAFRALDADGDGVIGEDELRRYLRSFNALYLDGYTTLHLDREAAANLEAFSTRWTEGLVEGMLAQPGTAEREKEKGKEKAPLTLEAWRAQPHAGQLMFIDAYVEHAGHCFGHMESKADRVIDDMRSKDQSRDLLRLVFGVATMSGVVSLFFL
ncbi:hypothetical protein T492DRAFT_898759 [Pavlovales sp. CCMP2436]|nr:hypothetical protein T492DRAFT_898759 [Pavlovales sp. CCMP2436]